MNLFEAIVTALVEGITEFLPISSTGHMVITSSLFGTQGEDFTKLFEVSIQLGAIMAVVVLYWKKFMDFKSFRFYGKLALAVIPALVFGKLLDDAIGESLENPAFIAWMFLLGGIVLVFVDRLFKDGTKQQDEQISFVDAAIIGLTQVLAVVLPGISRSAATIIGGLSRKLDRKTAAEFSFFLAVPTMAAATLYYLFVKKWTHSGSTQKGIDLVLASREHIIAFAVGNVVAFAVAIAAIRLFIGVLNQYGFKYFGIYRIVVGLLLLALIYTGHF